MTLQQLQSAMQARYGPQWAEPLRPGMPPRWVRPYTHGFSRRGIAAHTYPELLVTLRLAGTLSEARRLIKQRGVRIAFDTVVTDYGPVDAALFAEPETWVTIGKQAKRAAIAVVG